MFAGSDGIIGYPYIGVAGLPDTVAKFPLGTIMAGVDPYWGGGEFIYLQYPLSQAVKVGAVMAYNAATSFLSSLVANTALLSCPVAIALNAAASSASAQYGWFQIAGQAVIWSSASVAADTGIGVVAAGQGGAISALAGGKAINGARVTLPATTTVAKAGIADSGGSILKVPNTDGWFVGAQLTGTGVGAACLISAIDHDNRTVTMSVVTTAAIAGGTVTATYNDATNFFNVATINRPQMQGPIT